MADNNYEELFNSDVVDVDGKKIGSIGQVYLDDQTGQPSWVTVKTGWFGLKETFVPLEQAVVADGTITVPYSEEKVKDAPRVDPDKHLDADEEAQLYAYYGIATVLDTDVEAATAAEDAAEDAAAAEQVDEVVAEAPVLVEPEISAAEAAEGVDEVADPLAAAVSDSDDSPVEAPAEVSAHSLLTDDATIVDPQYLAEHTGDVDTAADLAPQADAAEAPAVVTGEDSVEDTIVEEALESADVAQADLYDEVRDPEQQ